jgi:signal transduction histidine kinase
MTSNGLNQVRRFNLLLDELLDLTRLRVGQFQLHNERCDIVLYVPGLGPGLYISTKIVKAHEGEIFLESHPGEGSTFTIEL